MFCFLDGTVVSIVSTYGIDSSGATCEFLYQWDMSSIHDSFSPISFSFPSSFRF